MWPNEESSGVLDSPDDAVGGVGGEAGMKSDGMQATVAIIDMMSIMSGTESKAGLMSCAS